MHIGAKLGFLAGGIPKAYAYIGSQSTTGGTTYTYSVPNFGGIAPSPTRLVVACIGTRLVGSRPITSCTINGVTATLYNQVGGASGENICMAIATVPTGTGSFDVIATMGSVQGIVISVYVLDGLESNVPYLYDSTQSYQITTGTIQDNSIVIATCTIRTASLTFSGTLGLVNDVSNTIYGDAKNACGSILKTIGGTGLTIIASSTYTNFEAIGYMSFK